MTGARHILPLLATLLLIAGCGPFKPAPSVPEDRFYQLAAHTPAKKFPEPPLTGLLVVEAPRASGLYASQALLYSETAPHLALQHYHYHRWIDTPPRLLQQRLVEYLRDANVAGSVAPEAGRATADWRASGKVRHFERIREGGTWKVTVGLDLRLDSAGAPRPLLVKEYDATVAAADDGIDATIVAFSIATGQVFDKFAADVAASQSGTTTTPPEPATTAPTP